MSTPSTTRTSRRHPGRLWLETSAGRIPASSIDFVGTMYEPGAHLVLTVPLFGRVTLRPPVPCRLRRLVRRFTNGFFVVIVESNSRAFTATTLCQSADAAERLEDSLLAALDEHRHRAGVLTHSETDGWTLQPHHTEAG